MFPLFIRILFICLLLSIQAESVGKPKTQFLIVPECMLSKKYHYETIGELDHIYLIKTNLSKFQIARSAQHQPQCNGFINVNEAWSQYFQTNRDATTFLQSYLPEVHPSDFTRTYKIQYQEVVRPLFQKIESKRMQRQLNKLTSFPDRFVNSKHGLQAAQWVQSRLVKFAETKTEVEVFEIPTVNEAKQFSVVMKIGKNISGSAIVIGAHLDTLEGLYENKPGADDNASGVVTLMEVARIITHNNMTFKKPIYFVWYAGQESGLLGSQSVVTYFKQHQIEVDAVMNLDETGFLHQKENGIGLTDDLTDALLTAFVADLVNTYVKVPVGVVRCGYACSDHALWYLNGNRVVYPFSTTRDEGNPNVHTKWDTVETVSLKHMIDFVKLGLAFVVELAEGGK